MTERKIPSTKRQRRGRASMPCVKCVSGIMYEHKLSRSGVTVDQCKHCGGIWFDRDELETILGDAAYKPLFIAAGASSKENVQCPRCRIPLATFNYPATSIEIDSCSACRGIWLDYQEWSEIRQARSGK